MSKRQKAAHRAKADRTTNHADRIIGPGRWRRRNFRGKEQRFGRFKLRRLGPMNRRTGERAHRDEWEWNATAVPAPKRYKRNRKANKQARRSRKV